MYSKQSGLTAVPEISSYMAADDHRSMRMKFGPVMLWYSYTTVVAFKVNGFNRVVHENDWSRTTGRQLNSIDGGGLAKKERVSSAMFEKLWNEQVFPVLMLDYQSAAQFVESPDYQRRRRIDRGLMMKIEPEKSDG